MYRIRGVELKQLSIESSSQLKSLSGYECTQCKVDVILYSSTTTTVRPLSCELFAFAGHAQMPIQTSCLRAYIRATPLQQRLSISPYTVWEFPPVSPSCRAVVCLSLRPYGSIMCSAPRRSKDENKFISTHPAPQFVCCNTGFAGRSSHLREATNGIATRLRAE